MASDYEFYEILESSKMACDLAAETNPEDAPVSAASGNPSYSSDEDDDLNYIIDIRKRFPMISDDTEDDGDEDLNCQEPLCSILSRLPDNSEDDLETLRAILRRFDRYSNPDVNFDGAYSDPDLDKGSSSPKAAEAFLDAIKKNRDSQRFIRSKLLHIKSLIEQCKEVRKRVEVLKGFQVACKRRTGRALSHKRDPSTQLISLPKMNAFAAKVMQYGPAENPQVAKFREVLEKSLPPCRAKWCKEDDQWLANGVKRKFQEMVFQRSVGLIKDGDESCANFDGIVASIGEVDVTPERMRQLLPMVNWDKLALVSVPGRSGDECRARWLSCENPLINQDPWTHMEDKTILHCVQMGLKNWFDIAVSLGTNRTPFQCLARYQRSLNASILKREWTAEEDDQLQAAVEAFGQSNWQIVAAEMEGRTGTQCSNRWLKTLHPARQRAGRWTAHEDKRLKVAVMFFGPKNWKKIAESVDGRTQVQCRERWVNCLNPSLNLNPWTEEEDTKLRQGIEEHGHCWSKVAACVPPRTDNQCRRRWAVILPDQVPLLQAAREMQKVSLISNFVDRESERPALGPNDFVPSPDIICLLESEGANLPKKRNRVNSSSRKVPNGTENKRRKRNSENPT